MSSTPGLTIGPLDPDASSELTARVGVHNKAARLLKQHAQNWPVELVNALSRPRDDERSDALDLGEVEDALRALSGRRAFFGEDDELLDASVRGSTDRDRIVSVVFAKPSGRTALGVIPYEGLEQSQRDFEEAQKAEKGVDPQTLLQALLARAEGGEISGVDASQVAALQEAAQAAEQAAREAKSALEAQQEELERLRNPEPWEGYDETNGDDIRARIKEGGLAEFGRAGLERIQTYEEGGKNRTGVKNAIGDALAEGPPPQA